MLLVCIFCMFFIITSLYIWKKSQIFFLAYLILFVYTIFTQIGYLLYPRDVNIVSHYQYYGYDAFFEYWLYIFLSFIFIFILFVILYDKKYKPTLRIEVSTLQKKDSRNLLYIVIILLYELVLIYFLIKNYSSASYYGQAILKHNTVWFYLFNINGIVLLSIIYKTIIEFDKTRKICYIIIFLFSISVFLITALKFGQRIEVLTWLLSLIVFLWYFFKNKIGGKARIFKKYVFIIGFIGIMFSQVVRSARGKHIKTLAAYLTVMVRPKTYLSLFQLKTLIFQDYLVPSLTLLTSMKYDIIFPGKVLESNLTCLVPFINHHSLGSILSRIIDPQGWGGYGYYILTEGYNFMGFAGFIYGAIVFTIGFRILESFFTNTNDKLFNAYMYAIIAFLSIYVIRGQSMMFLKGLYFYFLPAVILFKLISRKRVYLVKRRNKIRVTYSDHK